MMKVLDAMLAVLEKMIEVPIIVLVAPTISLPSLHFNQVFDDAPHSVIGGSPWGT